MESNKTFRSIDPSEYSLFGLYHLPLQILLSRLKKAYEKTPTSNYLTIFQINLIFGDQPKYFFSRKTFGKREGTTLQNYDWFWMQTAQLRHWKIWNRLKDWNSRKYEIIRCAASRRAIITVASQYTYFLPLSFGRRYQQVSCPKLYTDNVLTTA